ncbi:MAG: molecular chaperone DnaJ [Candidatus Diapherotrites archaeon]
MASKDYYSILGIDRSATPEQVKAAYKKLAKQWHPDVNKERNATEKFKEISEAYSILSNQEKRQTYDQFGSEAVNQGFSGSGQGGMPGFDFSDFFSGGMGGFGNMEDLLRQAFGGEFYGRENNRRETISHVRVDVELTFEEAALGTTKSISITHLTACPACNGTGSKTGKKETCPTCRGRGMATQIKRTPFGMFQTTFPCSHCRGTGETISNPCKTCDGKGSVKKTAELDVTIPPGVDTGNHLRVPGQGNYSHGKKGDAYVVLHVKPHPLFKRDGEDVYAEQFIPYEEAVLGGEISIPTLDGKKTTITIPPGTKTGKVFRLKGKGIARLNENGYGDEYVRVEVDVPSKPTKEEKELLEKLRSLKKGEPYSEKKKKKGFFTI